MAKIIDLEEYKHPEWLGVFDTCPFCGGKLEYREYEPGSMVAEAMCNDCGFSVDYTPPDKYMSNTVTFIEDGYEYVVTIDDDCDEDDCEFKIIYDEE